MKILAGLLVLFLLFPMQAFAQLTATQRLAVGPAPTPPSGSSVRIVGLGSTGGDGLVFTDAEGDMIKRALTRADLPGAIAYTDEPETITQSWTFQAGITGPLFVSGTLTSPIGIFTTRVRTPELITDSGQLSIGPANGVTEWMSSATSIVPATNYGPNLGLPSKKYKTLSVGELFVETIVAQERITTMGGRFTVTPSNVLTRDLPIGSVVACVKYNSFLYHVGGVEYGSKILMEKSGQFEWMRVLNITPITVDAAGDYCYNVDRNIDGSSENNWLAGDGIIDTGKTGSGMIDQFAVRGMTASTIEGPSIDFLLRTGDTWSNLSHRASIGNLNGRYGFGTDTYGLAAGDATAANLIAIPTKVALRYGTTEKITLDGSTGDISLAGNLLLTTGGSVTSTGNWSLTPTGGLTFLNTNTFVASKSVNFFSSGTTGSSIFGDGNSTNSFMWLQTRGSYTGGLQLVHTNSTARLTAELLSSSIGSIVELTRNSINTGYIGSSTVPWNRVYATDYYAGSAQGFTGAQYIRDINNVGCQMNFSGGIMITTNCPTTFP